MIVTWTMSSMSGFYIASIRVSFIVIPQIFIFYTNLLILSSKYLEQGKKTKYFIYIIILVTIFTLGGGFFDLYIDQTFPLSPIHGSKRTLLGFFVPRFFMSVIPIIISSLISKTVLLKKENQKNLEYKNQMLESESRALKAQINPHFLFNSLNNIYSLAQFKSDKTATAIIHLSDMLRYVTYESNKEFVSLQKEIEHINNFLFLEKLKEEDFSNIEVNIGVSVENYQIAPLLLINFIENAFKHGNHEDKNVGWIKINLRTEKNKITLSVSNSKSKNKKEKNIGIGLENSMKRLELIYPNKHKLTKHETDDTYNINLEIEL